MHSQILVIYPQYVSLADVMYPYQEIDKYEHEKLADERCQFFLTLKEDEIPEMLEKIKAYLEKCRDEYLEVLQYRTRHSYEECKKKYGGFTKRGLEGYTYFVDSLIEFEKIKNLAIDDPRQIQFIKKFGGWATDKWINIYIKDVGYGTWHNPYELWDYYGIVNQSRFPKDVNFLISKEDCKYNNLLLDVLDIDKTVKNIREYTRVWEHIIFCEHDPKNSRLYTIDDIRFGDKKCNSHCLVDNLDDVLVDIQKNYHDQGYMVTAIDSHW